MSVYQLKFLPDFVARTAAACCCICGGPIDLYQVGTGDYAVDVNITYSRIRGDSANGYEYSHHGCLKWEDK